MATTTSSKVLLKFADDENYYRCEIQRMSDHMVKITGLIQDLSGFQIFSDALTMIGDYSKYTYEYANPNLDANTYEYTDNNAVYPDEGSDKSTKEQLKDELQVYTDALMVNAKKTIANAIESEITAIETKIAEAQVTSEELVNEIQSSIVELYSVIEDLVKVTEDVANNTTTDTTTTDETATTTEG